MENNNVPKKPTLPTGGKASPSAPAKPAMPKPGVATPAKPQAPTKPSNANVSKPQVPPTAPVKPQTQPQVSAVKSKPMDEKDFDQKKSEKKLEDKSLDRYSKADRDIIKKQMAVNASIHKKRLGVHKPMIKNKGGIKVAHKVKPAKLYGAPIYEVLQARKRALAGGVIVVKKRKKKLFIWILLLFLLFGGVAGGSYVIMGNVIPGQSSIKVEDIDFDATDKRDFEVEVVRGYMPGQDIDKKLRINNTAKDVGVYVAYKFTVKEIDGDDLKDVNLIAEPYLLGEPAGPVNTSKWTVGTIAGETFYYSNDVLSSNEGENQITLFERYRLVTTNGLDENYLAGKQVKVTVTVYVLQEGYGNISTGEEVWRESPDSWKALMNK